MTARTVWRTMPVPAGLSLEQHSVAAQYLISDLLDDVAEEGLELVGKLRLTVKRQARGDLLELPDGSTVRLPPITLWTVEAPADVAR